MPLLIRPQAREKNSGSASIAAHFSGLKGAIKEIYFFLSLVYVQKRILVLSHLQLHFIPFGISNSQL